MHFQTINTDALQRATDVFVGPEGTAVIAKTYHMLAAAMQAAYNEGHLAGRMEAEENVEERLDNAFDEGFEQGSAFQETLDEDDHEQAREECYEDGYLEGVQEARACPGFADNKVQQIIFDRADAAMERLEAISDDDYDDFDRVIDEA